MSDIQKGRILENLAHGIPIVPFSDTPDGRIVHSLMKTREQDERHQRISRENQSTMVKGLASIYHKNEVSHSELMDSRNQTNDLLYDSLNTMRDQLVESYKTNENLGILQKINATGFQGVIEGQQNIAKTIHRSTDIINESLHTIDTSVRTGFANTQEVIKKTAKRAFGPELSRQEFNAVISTPDKLFDAISSYTKDILTFENKSQIDNLININLGSIDNKKQIEAFLLNETTKERYKPEILNELHQKIKLSTKLIATPSDIIKYSPDKIMHEIKFLKDLSIKYPNKNLQTFISNAIELFELIVKARNTPVSPDSLINFTNNEFISENAQHLVKRQYREARIRGTQTDINYNLMEANAQRDIANFHLNSIVDNIAESNVHLSNSNVHLINLEELTGNLIETTQAGFDQISDGIYDLSQVVALANAKLINELKIVGETIRSEIEYNSQLLEEILFLSRHSLDNLAEQRFKQGIFALNSKEYGDAYATFIDGVKNNRTSIENQFGAGLAAELNNDWDEAIERYTKTANYSESNNIVIASIARQKIARLQFAIGNTDEAIKQLKLAVETNKNNFNAKYEKVKFLALSGQNKEAIDELFQLIKENEDSLILTKDPAFFYLPVEELYENIWNKKLVTNFFNKIYLTYEFLALKNYEYALKINQELLASTVSINYLKTRIWDSELFKPIKSDLIEFIDVRLKKGALQSSWNERYAASFLLYYLDFDATIVCSNFKTELENDKSFYLKKPENIILAVRNIDKLNAKDFLKNIKPIIKDFQWLYNSI